MAHVSARLFRYFGDGDFSRENTLKRLDIEFAELSAMAEDNIDEMYLAMPAYVILGLCLGYLCVHRRKFDITQTARIDDLCRGIQSNMHLVILRPDKKVDYEELGRAFADPFVDIVRLSGDLMHCPELYRFASLIDRAISVTATRYFEADPDLHPTVLFAMCIDIDQFVVDHTCENIYSAIGALHGTLDGLTNEDLRAKLKDPHRYRSRRGDRMQRLIARKNAAQVGGIDHDLRAFLELAIHGAAATPGTTTKPMN